MDACVQDEVVVESGYLVSFMCSFAGVLLISSFNSIRNCRSPGFWEDTKPSKMAPAQIPGWMTFDDLWVDEVRRVMKACVVFLWYPIYCT